jgi:hypothetical protein
MAKHDIGELITALNEAENKLNNLRTKHDDLEKENARLRAALILARIAVSHACDLSDRILYTQDLRRIDAALGETQ